MKTVRVHILFLITLFLVSINIVQAQSHPLEVLTHDGLTRTYNTYIPNTLDESQLAPLLIALHQSTSSGKAMAAFTGLNSVADKYGFIVAYPNSTEPGWDDGHIEAGINPIDTMPIDDSGLIEALIDNLLESYPIDPERIYLTGIGTGGTLAYRVACDMPERIAGIAVINTLLWEYHLSRCSEVAAPAPVDVLLIHGTNNAFYFMDGREFDTGTTTFQVLGVDDTLTFWGERNGCDVSSSIEQYNRNTRRLTGCDDSSVAAYIIGGGAATWARNGDYNLNQYGVDASQMIMQFFMQDEAWTSAQEEAFTDTARSFQYYVPSSYNPSEPMPLVLVLHGRPGNGRGIAYITDMNTTAEEHGFIALYPDGLQQSWNYPRGTALYPANDTDDTAFLSSLIEDLSLDLNIDQTRIYVTGFSNGGFMTERLACEAPNQYAAFGVVGATAFWGMSEICAEQPPVPMLFMHGTQDVSIPWEGIEVSIGAREVYVAAPITNTLGFWTDHNGCDAEYETNDIPSLSETPETRVRVLTFAGCDMQFYGILGGGHNWPGVPGRISDAIAGAVNTDIHASEIMWEFFTNYTRNED